MDWGKRRREGEGGGGHNFTFKLRRLEGWWKKLEGGAPGEGV